MEELSMSKPIFEHENTIDPMDYKAKLEYIMQTMEEELFNGVELSKEKLKETVDKNPYLQRFQPKLYYLRNQIMPELTPMQVNAKLNELLRIFKPLTPTEAKNLPDTNYLDALKWYMQLISYLNKYITFLPSKQTFCAFANITTAIYNELLQDQNFSQVFNSIEDYLVDANFTSSQAGMVDNKTIISKLQMKDAGHNLIKSPEALTINNYNTIDKQQVNLQLERFQSMTKQINDKKRK